MYDELTLAPISRSAATGTPLTPIPHPYKHRPAVRQCHVATLLIVDIHDYIITWRSSQGTIPTHPPLCVLPWKRTTIALTPLHTTTTTDDGGSTEYLLYEKMQRN